MIGFLINHNKHQMATQVNKKLRSKRNVAILELISGTICIFKTFGTVSYKAIQSLTVTGTEINKTEFIFPHDIVST